MRTFTVLSLCYLTSSFTNAFLVTSLGATGSMQRQSNDVVMSWSQRSSTNICHLSTTEMNDGNTNKLRIDQASEEEDWQLYLQSKEVQVRLFLQ